MSELKVNTINAATSGQGVAVDVQNPKSFRNLVINGAMQVAQRGTSATAEGYKTVDRFIYDAGGEDETITQEQVDVASGTTPYTLGFRKAWKLTNGNQTGGAGASDYVQPQYRFEAQDIANSGWDYTSSSSFITLSFWVKSSVAGDYTLNLESQDGTSYRYLMEYTLSANTWTKVTKKIPGNSNLTVNNDNGIGLQIMWYPFLGSTYVQADQENNWYASSNSKFGTTSTTSWWTTNDATWEITGVQLEVGDVATDFEHRSYGDELARCQRYYQKMDVQAGTGYSNRPYLYYTQVSLNTPMRAAPTLADNTDYGVDTGDLDTLQAGDYTTITDGCNMDHSTASAVTIRGGNSSAYHWIRGRIHLTSEI